jgi:hypothetical protein
MRAYTLHLPPGASLQAAVPSTAAKGIPRLLPEGFAFWAFLLGPLWLFWHRCWLAGLGALGLLIAARFLPDPWGGPMMLGIQLLLGLHGQDLRRWTLRRRGWTLAHIVFGADLEAAQLRALAAEPRLAALYR